MISSRSIDSISWQVSRFDQIGSRQLYALMQLRVDVFVVEQQCLYRELDDLDTLEDTLHIIAHVAGYPNEVVACARAMAPNNSRPAVSIGRVVTHRDYRGVGLAREMMDKLMSACRETWPGKDIFLSAQVSVVAFYQSLGYCKVSDEYVEDGIPHIDMIFSEQNEIRPENPA